MTGHKTYVLDCSLTMAWFFEDEATPATDDLYDHLAEANVFAAELWPMEVANVLTLAQRKGRTTDAKVGQFLDRLLKQPITVDREGIALAFTHLIPLAKRHRLTVYDAAYLELAERKGIPLATLDKELSTAAKAQGVQLVRL